MEKLEELNYDGNKYKKMLEYAMGDENTELLDKVYARYNEADLSKEERKELFMTALWMNHIESVKWLDKKIIKFNIDDYDNFVDTILMLSDGWHNILKWLSDRIPADHMIRKHPALNILSPEWMAYMNKNR